MYAFTRLARGTLWGITRKCVCVPARLCVCFAPCKSPGKSFFCSQNTTLRAGHTSSINQESLFFFLLHFFLCCRTPVAFAAIPTNLSTHKGRHQGWTVWCVCTRTHKHSDDCKDQIELVLRPAPVPRALSRVLLVTGVQVSPGM